MKRIVFFLFAYITLNSCVTSTRFSDAVKASVSVDFQKKDTIASKLFILKTNKLTLIDSVAVSHRKSGFIIPLIFIGYWNSSLNCDINTHYFSNLFAEELNKKISENEYEKFLKDKIMEITIESVPTTINYTSDGYYVYTVYSYFYNYTKKMFAEKQKLSVSYRILQKNDVINSGNFSEYVQFSLYNSDHTFKKFTSEFISGYKSEFTRISDELIDRLLEDL